MSSKFITIGSFKYKVVDGGCEDKQGNIVQNNELIKTLDDANVEFDETGEQARDLVSASRQETSKDADATNGGEEEWNQWFNDRVANLPPDIAAAQRPKPVPPAPLSAKETLGKEEEAKLKNATVDNPDVIETVDLRGEPNLPAKAAKQPEPETDAEFMQRQLKNAQQAKAQAEAKAQAQQTAKDADATNGGKEEWNQWLNDRVANLPPDIAAAQRPKPVPPAPLSAKETLGKEEEAKLKNATVDNPDVIETVDLRGEPNLPAKAAKQPEPETDAEFMQRQFKNAEQTAQAQQTAQAEAKAQAEQAAQAEQDKRKAFAAKMADGNPKLGGFKERFINAMTGGAYQRQKEMDRTHYAIQELNNKDIAAQNKNTAIANNNAEMLGKIDVNPKTRGEATATPAMPGAVVTPELAKKYIPQPPQQAAQPQPPQQAAGYNPLTGAPPPTVAPPQGGAPQQTFSLTPYHGPAEQEPVITEGGETTTPAPAAPQNMRDLKTATMREDAKGSQKLNRHDATKGHTGAIEDVIFSTNSPEDVAVINSRKHTQEERIAAMDSILKKSVFTEDSLAKIPNNNINGAWHAVFRRNPGLKVPGDIFLLAGNIKNQIPGGDDVLEHIVTTLMGDDQEAKAALIQEAEAVYADKMSKFDEEKFNEAIAKNPQKYKDPTSNAYTALEEKFGKPYTWRDASNYLPPIPDDTPPPEEHEPEFDLPEPEPHDPEPKPQAGFFPSFDGKRALGAYGNFTNAQGAQMIYGTQLAETAKAQEQYQTALQREARAKAVDLGLQANQVLEAVKNEDPAKRGAAIEKWRNQLENDPQYSTYGVSPEEANMRQQIKDSTVQRMAAQAQQAGFEYQRETAIATGVNKLAGVTANVSQGVYANNPQAAVYDTLSVIGEMGQHLSPLKRNQIVTDSISGLGQAQIGYAIQKTLEEAGGNPIENVEAISAQYNKELAVLVGAGHVVGEYNKDVADVLNIKMTELSEKAKKALLDNNFEYFKAQQAEYERAETQGLPNTARAIAAVNAPKFKAFYDRGDIDGDSFYKGRDYFKPVIQKSTGGGGSGGGGTSLSLTAAASGVLPALNNFIQSGGVEGITAYSPDRALNTIIAEMDNSKKEWGDHAIDLANKEGRGNDPLIQIAKREAAFRELAAQMIAAKDNPAGYSGILDMITTTEEVAGILDTKNYAYAPGDLKAIAFESTQSALYALFRSEKPIDAIKGIRENEAKKVLDIFSINPTSAAGGDFVVIEPDEQQRRTMDKSLDVAHEILNKHYSSAGGNMRLDRVTNDETTIRQIENAAATIGRDVLRRHLKGGTQDNEKFEFVFNDNGSVTYKYDGKNIGEWYFGGNGSYYR